MYIYILIYIFIDVHIYLKIHVSILIYIYMYIYIHIYKYVRMHVCMYTDIYIHTHIYSVAPILQHPPTRSIQVTADTASLPKCTRILASHDAISPSFLRIHMLGRAFGNQHIFNCIPSCHDTHRTLVAGQSTSRQWAWADMAYTHTAPRSNTGWDRLCAQEPNAKSTQPARHK